MEAFQGFCRAKTNFYVMVKRGDGLQGDVVDEPRWFADGKTWISNAPTIGINKDGQELYTIDPSTKRRTDKINDVASEDVSALIEGDGRTRTSRFVDKTPIAESLIGIPQYYDRRTIEDFESWAAEALGGCSFESLGSLVDEGRIFVRGGQGSPSLDFRTGDVPFIKVSDLRNRQVNVNSTNMVPEAVAERFWKGKGSGVKARVVVTPARASKNIGEPVMVLPGQERIVLTKEVVIMRALACGVFSASSTGSSPAISAPPTYTRSSRRAPRGIRSLPSAR